MRNNIFASGCAAVASIALLAFTASASAAEGPHRLAADQGTEAVQKGEVDPFGAQTDRDSPPAPVPSKESTADSFVPRPGGDYEWSIEAPGTNNKRSDKNAHTDLSAAGTEGIPYAGWAACGVFDNRFKVVHDYRRKYVHNRQERKYTRLYCGLRDKDGSTNRFGYRHIKDKHLNHWARKSSYINRNWRDLAGWAMKYTSKNPNAVFVQSKRFCYQRKFYLYYGNTKVSEMRAVIYLGKTGVRIMTAYPTNKGTCNGTKIWG